MRRVRVVTTSRADFGIYLPVLRELMTRGDLDCRVLVSGAHLDARDGLTVSDIEAAGVPIGARIQVHAQTDRPIDIAETMAKGVEGFATYFSAEPTDLLVVLGDRYEMFAAAIAAVPFKIPIAHIHGGELTAGAFDDAIRHSITKLSHLHFTSTETYAARVRQMGEEAWRVTVCGAPGLDNLVGFVPASRDEVTTTAGLAFGDFLLVTFHPTTLDSASPREQVAVLLSMLNNLGMPVLFTAPNADPGRSEILAVVEAYVAGHPGRAAVATSLGTRLYFSAMAHATAMVGNSSSGIIEAASFGLPVLDIGPRQEGRLKPPNVVSVPNTAEDIRRGLACVTQAEFRRRLAGLPNPYFAGGAATVIADRLASVSLGERLIVKRFVEVA